MKGIFSTHLYLFIYFTPKWERISGTHKLTEAHVASGPAPETGAAGVREDLWRAPASSCPQHLPRLLSHEPCSLGTSSPQSSRPPPGRVSRQRRRGSAGKGVTPLPVKG